MCGLASAQTTAYTTPVGYTSITCPANTDTRVGLPFRQPTVAAAALSAPPSGNVLTVASAAFGTYANTHYVKFTGTGLDSGKIFPITANSATTITIDLNGDTLSAVSGDTFSVTKFWTLSEIFDPTVCKADNTTGNAIVLSTAAAHKTEVLLPDLVTNGVNLATAGTYYVALTSGVNQWRGPIVPVTNPSGIYNNLQLWPGTSFIIRNRVTVTFPTTYVCTGEVDMGNEVIHLRALAGLTNKQDTLVALTRPVDVTLDQLALGGTSAFMSTIIASTPKDALLMYDSTASGQNKATVATYYYYAPAAGSPRWIKAGAGNTNDVGATTIIPAGTGFLIRKVGVASATTLFWKNTPSY